MKPPARRAGSCSRRRPLAFVAALVALLPGVDRLVPRTPVPFVAVVSATATLVPAALLLSAAPSSHC